ncbi:MAG: serine hydrolase [Bacteroidota bacterium]
MKNKPKSNVTCVLFCIAVVLSSCKLKQESSETDVKGVLDFHGQNLLEDTSAFATSISVIKNGKTITEHYGEIDKGKGNKITDTTLFEIASVTKVFTGTLMAKAVVDGKVNLNDDVRKFLPEKYPNLEYQGYPIRIRDLLGFKSGVNRTFPDVSSLRKIEDDSTALKLEAFGLGYTKSDFFEDLRKVELDTFPGTMSFYNELCPELAGYILERTYQEDYRTIVQNELLEKLEMKTTFFTNPKSKKLLNGYNENEKLMPNFGYRIWGAGGMLKSTIGDLNKFLKYHLRTDDKVVLEARSNIENSLENWNGYLWDDIGITRYGLRCMKHGGAYGVQNMFVIYPERNLGVSIVINQSTPMTHEKLRIVVNSIVADLFDSNEDFDKNYGYRIENENVVFQYTHPKNLTHDLINSISVAGTFNNWNPNNSSYQMSSLGEGVYELSIPKADLPNTGVHEFRFVINRNSWLSVPKAIPNRTFSEKYNNITLSLD